MLRRGGDSYVTVNGVELGLSLKLVRFGLFADFFNVHTYIVLIRKERTKIVFRSIWF